MRNMKMNYESALCIKVALLLFPVYVAVIRLLYILPALHTAPKPQPVADSLHGLLMVFLGSGGHTGEMLRLLEKVDVGLHNRTWVTGEGDVASLEKVALFEQSVESAYPPQFMVLPRARAVGESVGSSIKSTARSLASVVHQLWKSSPPDVLVVNGPGTSVPLAYTLFAFKFLGLASTRIVYIESLARVRSLSVLGLLLLPISNRFIVQWEPLYHKYHRVEYYGMLM